VAGAATFNGNLTHGNAVTDVLILNGRVATGSAAGAALAIGATYTYGEAIELRQTISDWTGVGSSFKGLYFRTEATADGATHTLMGAEIYAVQNAVGVVDSKGILVYNYVKGDTAETITTAYAVQAEFTMDASRATDLTATEVTPLLCKVTGGKMADYTAVSGVIIRLGDMDGGSRTYGDGIKMVDDANMSGTSVLTNVLYTDMAATALVKVSASGKGAVTVGTFTNNVVGANPSAYIRIDVGATPYYVPAYATQPA
jgi:hypothetical protein